MNKGLLKYAALFAALAVAAGSAASKDFGVQGTIWPIVETDIRQLMVASASEADWGKAQTELKKSAENYLDNLSKRYLPVANTTATVWIDPSIVLTSDVQAPVEGPDGKLAWRTLHKKGAKANPLEAYRPTTAMLFFDGSKPEQLELVREVLRREPNRIVPVEAGAGNIGDTNRALKRAVYYANDAMVTRFQVQYLPSLLYAGTGPRRLYLGLTSFAIPFNPAEVISAWPELTADVARRGGK